MHFIHTLESLRPLIVLHLVFSPQPLQLLPLLHLILHHPFSLFDRFRLDCTLSYPLLTLFFIVPHHIDAPLLEQIDPLSVPILNLFLHFFQVLLFVHLRFEQPVESVLQLLERVNALQLLPGVIDP